MGPLRRALTPHPCHGATAVVAPRGDIIILECGSCASNLSTSSIAPVHPVGSGTSALRAARTTHSSRTCHAVSAGKRIYEPFVNIPELELGYSVPACHSAFRLVTGTGATRWH